ncbi:hypothetical protein K1X80_19995 [Pseudomonas sp. So3.2b]|uniref:hypothetical protein n=1 Tax=Pseudomonas sp. So3.2b TaxID=2864101 RepID=UPI001C689C3C|nr:hypothetical protein [Pseudomonas sp. So3.2b]QYM67283.1 hypothetical protein K1X80_19995 [Pseudomonas sp. So3.2b]
MIKTKQFLIQCPQCGSEEFKIPENVQDEDLVICGFCNFEAPLHEIRAIGIEQAKQVVIPEAKKAIEDMLKKAFKGWKK